MSDQPRPEIWRQFPAFYANPVIIKLANNPKWTVSDKDKRPIDMARFRFEHRVVGAAFPDPPCTCTLPELMRDFPDAPNHAYYLDALKDDIVIMDIEPTCPPDEARKLLNMPWLYGEVSLSGKGYHLAFRLPREILNKYPDALNKERMFHPMKYWELHLLHWVTFTRRMIQPQANNQPFEPIFEWLCQQQRAVNALDFQIDLEPPENIPYEDGILKTITGVTCKQSLADKHGDISAWEFSQAIFYCSKLQQILQANVIKSNGHTYTDTEQCWLIYYALKKRLPHRDKHDSYRNDMPWLLYLAHEALAKYQAGK